MPILPHILERMRWSRISEQVKRRFLNEIPSRAFYSVPREMRRGIVLKANEIGIPRNRLREHFETLLRKGVPRFALGERMLRDLEEAEQLKEATGVEEERFKNFLNNRSFAAALEEMRQHAQAMQQMRPAA